MVLNLFFPFIVALVPAIVAGFLVLDAVNVLATVLVKFIVYIKTKNKNSSNYKSPHPDILNSSSKRNEFRIFNHSLVNTNPTAKPHNNKDNNYYFDDDFPRYIQPIAFLVTLTSRHIRIIPNKGAVKNTSNPRLESILKQGSK